MKALLNVAGPQIRKIRYGQAMTQEVLAARCEAGGLIMSRSTLAKIETQIRCVTDKELLTLAKALKVKMRDFFPDHQALF
jgi:transcriptional regulator with XRE-family HTH domain